MRDGDETADDGPHVRGSAADVPGGRQRPSGAHRRRADRGDLTVCSAPAGRPAPDRAPRSIRRVARWEVFSGPLDVFLSDTTVVEPDVLFVRAQSAGKLEKKFVRSAPDLVVEVSSPSTRRLDLVRKRELYERFGIPEYWYVDLDAERVEAYRLV